MKGTDLPISQSGFRPERFVFALDEQLCSRIRFGEDRYSRWAVFKEKEGVVHDSLISSELSFFLSFSFYFDVATLQESDFSIYIS